jgi:hypothetical protein
LSASSGTYNYLKGKICPYCQSPLKKNADAVICSSCGTPHHKECWEENRGCTTYGCALNPTTEESFDLPEEAVDVGDQTLEAIRESLERQGVEPSIDCPNCSQKIESLATYCKHCGFNVKDNKFDDATADFEKDYKKRYKDKVSITRNRFYITMASFMILLITFGVLGVLTVKRLNEYFASDQYIIKSTIDSWIEARREKNIENIKSFLTDDYEYYGKDGKKQDLKERLRRMEQIYKNDPDITIGISDFTMVNDTTVTPNDKRVTFFENFKAGKITERGKKTVRLYKGAETDERWKIYREILEN